MRSTIPWLLVAVAACGGPEVGTTPCEPLAAEVTQEALVAVRGVGEAADGTLYVIDDVGTEARAYVSAGGVLVRHRVQGFGESREGDVTTLVLTVSGDPEDFALGHESSPAGERMAVAFGMDEARDLDEVVAVGEELAVVGESAIAGMAAEFRREVVVEYFAAVDATEHVVVTRPRDDWGYEDFRLFLGPLDALAERKVYDVVRARDGGSTTIDFDYHGDDATLSFPYVNLEPGQATLEVGASTQDVSWLDTEDLVESSSDFLSF